MASRPRASARRRAPRGAEPSLAVLPFDNYSGDASQDYFVNGMTEALIADLARVRGLRVISRTSSMHYQGQKKSLPEIAGELGVDLLVEGSVARAGNRVRITAQLIDGASDEHIWARSYEEKVEDVLALQSRIATAIAGEVRGAVSSSAARARGAPSIPRSTTSTCADGMPGIPAARKDSSRRGPTSSRRSTRTRPSRWRTPALPTPTRSRAC